MKNPDAEITAMIQRAVAQGLSPFLEKVLSGRPSTGPPEPVGGDQPFVPPTPVASTSPLLSDVETAGYLRCSKSTVWQRVRDGTLPPPVHIGKSARWLRAELDIAIQRLAAARPTAPFDFGKVPASDDDEDDRPAAA